LLHWHGMVIVPTGCGEILALDLPTLHVRWRYVYPDLPGPGIAYEPRIVGGRLFYAGPDSHRLHALDPDSGKAMWTVPVQPGDHDFATVQGGGVLVRGTRHLRLLDAETGKTRGTLATGLVAGEGYEGKGGLYYHPVVGEKDDPDAVVVVDLARGKEARRIVMPKGVRLGNLVPMGPLVANATPYAVSVLGPEK
jgi:outer membrane protein assembly factor BamB